MNHSHPPVFQREPHRVLRVVDLVFLIPGLTALYPEVDFSALRTLVQESPGSRHDAIRHPDITLNILEHLFLLISHPLHQTSLIIETTYYLH